MKRSVVLGVLVTVGALSIAVAAQQAPARTVDVEKLKENLYVLKGGGGNTAVFITSTGVVVVDAKNPGWGQPILDAVKKAKLTADQRQLQLKSAEVKIRDLEGKLNACKTNREHSHKCYVEADLNHPESDPT